MRQGNKWATFDDQSFVRPWNHANLFDILGRNRRCDPPAAAELEFETL
jgi:hypothetical protein